MDNTLAVYLSQWSFVHCIMMFSGHESCGLSHGRYAAGGMAVTVGHTHAEHLHCTPLRHFPKVTSLNIK